MRLNNLSRPVSYIQDGLEFTNRTAEGMQECLQELAHLRKFADLEQQPELSGVYTAIMRYARVVRDERGKL